MADARRRELGWGPAELRATRERLGLTQGDMAYLLGVSELTVTRWENPIEDQSRMPQPRLVRLAVEAIEMALSYRNGAAGDPFMALCELVWSDLDTEGRVQKGAA